MAHQSSRRPVSRTLVSLLLGLATSAAVTLSSAAGEQLGEPVGEILLEIEGNIEQTNGDQGALLDRALLEQLPPAVLNTSTVVTDGVKRFEGFYMRDLLAWLGANGETVTARALNDYVIDIPIEDFTRFDVIVATHMDGKRLSSRDKGPLWIVYPRDDHEELQDLRYDYRWVWQLDYLKIQ